MTKEQIRATTSGNREKLEQEYILLAEKFGKLKKSHREMTAATKIMIGAMKERGLIRSVDTMEYALGQAEKLRVTL